MNALRNGGNGPRVGAKMRVIPRQVGTRLFVTMMMGAVLVAVFMDDASAESAVGNGLKLSIYNNTALAGTPLSTSLIPSLSLTLPGQTPFSAEVIGTWNPNFGNDNAEWSWHCSFSQNIAFAFVKIDGHSICPGQDRSPYNNSARGMIDNTAARLLNKKKNLVISMVLYHLKTTGANEVKAIVQLCRASGSCVDLLTDNLSPSIPPEETQRRTMQRSLASGWGTWLHRDILSIVLLPDSASLTIMLCRISNSHCLREMQIDGNGGSDRNKSQNVRIGRHAMNHSYSQLYLNGPDDSIQQKVNISIEYAVSGATSRDLDILITPQILPGIGGGDNGADLSDFAVVLAGSFAWARLGNVTLNDPKTELQLLGHGLPQENSVRMKSCTPASANMAKNLSSLGVFPPGKLGGESCDNGPSECSSRTCGLDGLCTPPQRQMIHLAVGLDSGKPVAFTSRSDNYPSANNNTEKTSQKILQDVQRRIEQQRRKTEAHDTRLWPQNRRALDLAFAATAALSWRNIYVPFEEGPVMPMTYGFSWITPISTGYSTPDKGYINDWKYILFCWDNIFASYTAGVLGYKDAAYSNLIQIVKSKHNDGYVPNWAAGGSKNTVAEPAVGGRVLLELYKRFGDKWLVDLLFDDLLDWNNWQWDRRRVVSDREDCCVEPGFITIGNDYSNCTGAQNNCPGGGESGLDQSPLWDCPDAHPDGSDGNCNVFNTTSKAGPNPSHVLQIADTQSTSLFIIDALALAELSTVLSEQTPARINERDTLLQRAKAMQEQIKHLFDPSQNTFADRFVQTGEFSTKLTPTALYPMMVDGAVSTAQAAAMISHLTNASELCISNKSDAKRENSSCFWGLPSISASDPSFMQPQSYIYWRGLTWGPMTLLSWWSLDDWANYINGSNIKMSTAITRDRVQVRIILISKSPTAIISPLHCNTIHYFFYRIICRTQHGYLRSSRPISC